jgi:hypothetical protein
VRNNDILSVNQVVPGSLVLHRYNPEIGVVLRVSWNEDFIPFIWENLTLLSEAP